MGDDEQEGVTNMDLANAHNPYDFSNPVSDADLLIGRDHEMQEIRYYLDNAAAAPRPINLALLGQRASGKTSMLNIIEIEAKERHFCAVRINLDEDDVSTQLAFFSKLFDCILSAACDDGAFGGKTGKTYDIYLDMVNAFEVPDDKTCCPFTFPIQIAKARSVGNDAAFVSEHNIRSDLEKVHAELQRPIILLFDEGNVLAQSRALLQKLRNIFMNTRGFMLVMTGTPDLFPVMDDVFSPIVRQFKKIDVGDFSNNQDTRECIRKPLQKLGIDPLEIFDFETYRDVNDIHDLSGGRPYEIQLICHMLFRRIQFKRADKMRLDFGVLEEVRHELEKWQDITNRPILTAIRSLDKARLEQLSVLCLLDGSATFDQVWLFEYVFRGNERWTKDELERALAWFCRVGIVRLDDDRIVFAGDDFDRIYTKYLAREHGVFLRYSKLPLSWHWRRQLESYVQRSLHGRLESLDDFSFRGEIDIFSVVASLSAPETDEDVFVESEPIGVAVYRLMMENLGKEVIALLHVNSQLPELNESSLFSASNPSDPDAIAAGIREIDLLRGRFTELGGSLVAERRDLPIIPPNILAEKVMRSANKRLRLSLADYHAAEMRDLYVEARDSAKAEFHARLCCQYNPEIKGVDSNNIGYLYLSLDEFDLARKYLERVANQSDDIEGDEFDDEADKSTVALANYNLGILEAKRGHFAQAVSEIERCIEILRGRDVQEPTDYCLWVPVIDGDRVSFAEQPGADLIRASDEALQVLRTISSKREAGARRSMRLHTRKNH